MKVTETDVTYVADLANLELTVQERQSLAKELNSILEYIELLNEWTRECPPMAQTSDRLLHAEKQVATNLRYARVRTCSAHLCPSGSGKNAPDSMEIFFKVPKVIEDEYNDGGAETRKQRKNRRRSTRKTQMNSRFRNAPARRTPFH